MTPQKTSLLVPPYGGRLVDLIAPGEVLDGLKAYANQLPSLRLSEHSVCDLENSWRPGRFLLDRFLGEADHQHVKDMAGALSLLLARCVRQGGEMMGGSCGKGRRARLEV
jgi:hypothetical protein